MKVTLDFLLLPFLSYADEAFVGTWQSGSDVAEIGNDGTVVLHTSIEVAEVVTATELGFGEYPDTEEVLAVLLEGRRIHASLAGTWKIRGSRFVTGYQTAETMGWDEIVQDIMDVAGPVIEARLERSSQENRKAMVSAYRELVSSLFSAEETFRIGEEISVAWSFEGDALTLGEAVYNRAGSTAVKSVSWGELKKTGRRWGR